MAYVGVLLVVLVDNALRLIAPDVMGLQSAPPQLPLITALYIGFRARHSGELGLAIVLGIFADCFSGVPVGHFAFLYGAAAYFALRVRRYVPPDAFVSHVVAAFFCALLTVFFGLLLAVFTVRGFATGAGFVRAVSQALVSALCAPFVFGLWDRSGFFRRALGGRGYEFA